MPRFIASPSDPRFPAQEHEMRALFGVTKGHWPAEGCKAREIQGIWVHVLPADHVSLRPRDGQRKRSTHRVIAACPDCGRAVSAGRLRQHRCDAKPRRGSVARRSVDRIFQTAELNVTRMQAKSDQEEQS